MSAQRKMVIEKSKSRTRNKGFEWYFGRAVKRGCDPSDIYLHLESLRASASAKNKSAWDFARLAWDAEQRFGFRLSALAEFVKPYSIPRVSEFVSTFETFKDSPLANSATFDLANSARKAWNMLDNTAKQSSRPEDVLQFFMDNNYSTRQARKEIARRTRIDRLAASLAAATQAAEEHPELLDSCRRIDCLKLIDELPAHSVRLALFDPPYLGYKRLGKGTYTTGHDDVSGLEADADSLDRDTALHLYCDYLRRIERVLQKNGVVAVFLSATTSSDMPAFLQILKAIDDGGLQIAHELFWRKNAIPPKNFERPFSTQTETIWLLCRKSEEIQDCFDYNGPRPEYLPPDLSLRSNVLDFPTCTKRFLADRKAGRPTELVVHQFEKPLPLGMYLIEKLSYPGELVWDSCGCHGNFTLSAIRTGRRFLYSESHRDRFAEGLRRIHLEVEAKTVPVESSGQVPVEKVAACCSDQNVGLSVLEYSEAA